MDRYVSNQEEDTLQHAFQFARALQNNVVLLTGELGAGKTTWTRGFANGLGIDDEVASPSYTLMNVYKTGSRVLYHFDLYRIGCLEEARDIGLFEVLEEGQPCVIEWADRVPEIRSWLHNHVEITLLEDGTRSITTTDSIAPAIPGNRCRADNEREGLEQK
ncbi:MAG: tRNA (adenosine(37)-N6)-threonylcarbamoyltransferase complex ATPase subunit type 1 TsaE [Candidatus Riflebacteria bacterium]|nr:tRNA (adenosine(37)-N6)-threonylcarbamoyltransferase complex ATPase subunit type 1 TsaE [Candidatus Riflebacteria bacterium]